MNKINEKNFKEYFNLDKGSKFIYDDFFVSKKIDDKFFVSKNARNQYVIFDVYSNIASLGESFREFDTESEAIDYIRTLNSNARANYYNN